MGHVGTTYEQGIGRQEAAATNGETQQVGRATMRPANLMRHRVEVHTVTLRAFGTLHAREGVALARILNGSDRPHVSLTAAHLYASSVEQPPAPQLRLYSTGYAAIPKSAVMWVVGGLAEAYEPSLRLEPRDTYLIYPTFVLAGAIHMRPEVRFSDAIGTALVNKPFVTLHDARVLDRRAADTPLVELPSLRDAPHVTVDLRKATAIVDRDGGVAPSDAMSDDDVALLEDLEIDIGGVDLVPELV